MKSIKGEIWKRIVCGCGKEYRERLSGCLWQKIMGDLWAFLDMNLWENLRDVIQEYLWGCYEEYC